MSHDPKLRNQIMAVVALTYLLIMGILALTGILP